MYFWFAMIPANPRADLLTYFSLQQVEEGRTYSRALRIAFITSFAVQCGYLAWLLFNGRGLAISQMLLRAVPERPLLCSMLFFVFVWLSLQAINFPSTFFRSFVWQQQWGFSTQTPASWLLDYLKGIGLDLLLTGTGVIMLIQAMHRLPKFWWLAAAVFTSVWIVLASYLWPVVVSPLFNRFTPADDPVVTAMVKQLADKAGLPINEVLVMDASRRTTRANAYFACVGETRRVVLYDNLLRDYPFDEVESVVAHELAHWRQGHITKGMLWGMLGSFLAWGLLFLILRISLPGSTSPPPHIWLFILLFLNLGSFVTLPIQNAISRQMEREADSIAVMLTENREAAIRLQISLAVKNHSDVDPPTYLRLFSTHPSAFERIAAITRDGQ
jgi:STE24 endopeptidase